jgi:VWFA-related protein
MNMPIMGANGRTVRAAAELLLKLSAAFCLLSLSHGWGQDPPAAGKDVLLDLVVRDKKSQQVTNLEPTELEVYDDGVRREITSFRRVEGGDTRLVTLVYNHLDLESRGLGRKASLDFLKNEFPANVFLSVLVLDDGVRVLQAFTRDRNLIMNAVERANSGTSAEIFADSERIETELNRGSVGNPMAQIILNTLQNARGSRGAIPELIGIVSQQYRVPGRKSILFFSNGFGLPPGMEDAWKTLISTANRFNVAFYPIDSHGISTTNENSQSISEMKDAAAASQLDTLTHGNNTITPTIAKSQDIPIGSGKAKEVQTLAALAQSTGGFLIANDFRNDLRRVSEDIANYYQLTYNPEIDRYDGSFRKIEVRSTRPNLRIQSRAGYLAVPVSAGKQDAVPAFELPLVQALAASPLPRSFEFQSTVLHFIGHGQTPVGSIVLDVPIGNLTLSEPKPGMPYEGGLAYIALIRSAGGEMVRRFRGQTPISAAPEQLDALKDSHFLYHESFDLSPGRYTLETSVSDRNGDRISARRSSFLIPAPQTRLAMSSVSIVRGVRGTNEGATTFDPFLVRGKSVTPALSPQMQKASAEALSFYFVVYPDKIDAETPKLIMKFMRDGVPFSEGSSDLGGPDDNGRIQYIATAKTAKMPPGNYQVEFFVSQGSQTAHEFIWFSLQ